MANIPITSLASLASATSANGTARNGAAIIANWFDPGACHFLCISTITTSSVAATFKLQGTFDGSTYYDITGATWTSAAGTGAPVSTRQSLTVPTSAQCFKQVRCVATLAGAATAGADVTAVVGYYNPFGRLFGAATI